MRIAVLTASKPSRELLRSECVTSVKMQGLSAAEHVVMIDHHGEGPEVLHNRAVRELDSSIDWLAFLDDDDLMLPYHLEKLSAAATDADVVYSRCQLDLSCREFSAEGLRRKNYISMTSLVRRAMFERVEGFDEQHRGIGYDWRLWLRILDAGGRFKFVPDVTWIYRIQSDSMNWSACA